MSVSYRDLLGWFVGAVVRRLKDPSFSPWRRATNRLFEQGTSWCQKALLVGFLPLGCLFATPSSWAAENTISDQGTSSICLVVAAGGSQQLQDAIQRIRAELQAAGFVVLLGPARKQLEKSIDNPPAVCAGAQGYLRLTPSGSHLSIVATAALDDVPLTQQVDLTAPSTTPEMIAIRAVEGLRAALIQSMRESKGGSQATSEAVQQFTRFSGPSSRSESSTQRETTPEDSGSPTVRPSSAQRGGALITLGPAVTADGAKPGTSAELSAGWQIGAFAFGVLADASLLPGRWNSEAGSLGLRQYSILGRTAWRAPCRGRLECQAGISFGLRHIAIDPSPAPTTTTQMDISSETHSSALLQGDLFAGYFFHSFWGIGSRLRAGALLNAPAPRIGDEERLWGRPAVSGSLIIATRFR